MLNRLTLFAYLLCSCLTIYGQGPAPTPVPKMTMTPDYRGPVTAPVAGSPDGALPGGVLNGKATSLPAPDYPSAARAIKATGSVSVQVLIGEDGSIITATAISGNPLLRAAAVSAAKQAKFSPTRLEGVPVKVSGIITYNFVGPYSLETEILRIGYDLADGELSRSFNAVPIKQNLPPGWAEERLLLEKITAGITKFALENAAKAEAEESAGGAAQRKKDQDDGRPPRDPDHYIVVGGGSISHSGEKAVNIGPETVADLVELQTLISRRLSGNENVLWHFKYGQTLARLRGAADDEIRFAAAVSDLRALLGSVPVEALRPNLEKLLAIAEVVSAEPAKKAELKGFINNLRYR